MSFKLDDPRREDEVDPTAITVTLSSAVALGETIYFVDELGHVHELVGDHWEPVKT